MPTNTPVGTLYRRALRRVERRAHARATNRAYHAAAIPDVPHGLCASCSGADQLLREAVRTCNTLARMLPPARGRRED